MSTNTSNPTSSSKPEWQKVAECKRNDIDILLRDYGIPSDSIPSPNALRDATSYPTQFLSEREVAITEIASAVELLSGLQKQEFTALEVTKAFCRRAAIAHQLTNCLSEVLFEQALQRAAELDGYIKEHGKPIGPLHGLPMSLKDQFRVEGAETSLGFVGWLGRKETKDDESLIVRDLKRMGAVIFAKTNVPSGLMAIETNNNIIGNTLNPRNRLLSAGGSSGGEGALLAMRGSIVGFGSDLAASIRLPCSVNGIYGLKPSHGRLPYLNVANSLEGQEINNSVIGPMAHSVEDLTLLVKALLSQNPWLHDPTVVKLPWQQSKSHNVRLQGSTGGLSFGVLRCDGVVKPHPPVARALEEVVAKLIATGNEVIEWNPPPHSEGFDILWNTFITDGGADIHRSFASSGEIPVPQIAGVYGIKPGHLPIKSISESWDLAKRRTNYQTAYLEYWNSTAKLTKTGKPVDFVLLPVTPTASYQIGEGLYPGYTGVISILDFAAAVVPVSSVDATIDAPVARTSFLTDFDKLIWSQYDPSLFDGTPVGVQIMGRRLDEEGVLGAAAEIQRCVGLSSCR